MFPVNLIMNTSRSARGKYDTNQVKNISKPKRYCRSDDSLHDAAKGGDLSVVTCLVKEGSNVNAKDSNGKTSLYFAVKYGHLNIVEYLVNEGKVDVSAKDNKGEISLYYAVKYGNLDIAKYLIEKFNIKNGYTPLHWAAEKGSLDTVKYLMDEKKIDVNIRDRNRYTPLHYAAQNGKLEMVKYLVGQKKADLYAKEKCGETPIHLATKNNHLDAVKYLMNEANLDSTDKHIYTVDKVNNEVDGLNLLAKGKGEIIDRVIGIVDIAFGVKDILQELGILPDRQSEDFENVLNAIGKNYAAIEEVGNKVDRNFVAMKVIFEMVGKTLSTIEETRIEMRQGFKHVLESISELKVGDKISSLTTFMDDFIKNIDVVKKLSPNVHVAELERPGGILDKLRNAVTSEGILHGNLYHIINQRLATPKEAEDNLAFATLHVLYYGVQIYVSAMFFVLEQYSYLADHYYQKGDIEKCNEYFDLLLISFNDFKESLLSNGNKKRLIAKVTDILSEVQGLPFVRNKREEVFKLLQKRIDSLSLVTQKLQEMKLPIVGDQPEVIMRKPEFSKSEVKTPIGEWKDGAKVSYAIQYKDNNTYSKIGKWSDAFTVYEKASPFLKIPVDHYERTRLIFRKFDNDKPKLVGTIEDKVQNSFRDISRDLYDAALSSNEDIAKKEVEILIHNGADINEIYDDGRRAIHAAAQGGNSQIASDFLIKNNATDINVKDINGYTPIYIAAEAGYEDFVKFSISSGADVNVKTNSGNFTPLHISTYKGDVSTVEVLMQSDKIDMNARDKVGFTPLHSAVFGGTKVVNTLSLSNNTDINAKSKEGLTPLHLASINDFEDIAEVLVKNNEVDINAVANGNLTALHFASSMGNLKVVQFLARQNETDIDVKSADGWTALHFAAFLKEEDTALELLKVENIDVDAKGKNNITPLHVSTVTGQKNVISSLLKRGALMEEKTQDSLTALHLAAMRNKCEIIPILIDNGANIEAKTINGSTPLHLASFAGSSNSTSILLNRGADTKLYDNNGYIPVHVAILNGKTDTVGVLVEYENDLVNVTDKDGEFPLHLAAKTGYVDIINCLVNNKIDINVRNNVGETPLHYAAKNGNSYAIEALAEKGADLNIKDDSGWAPLHWAARDNYPDAIKAFAEKKANLTVRDNDSFTPLHLAARYNCPNATKALAEVGVDLNIRDNNGSAPLHLAAKNGNLETVECLIECPVEKKAEVNARDNFSLIPLHLATKLGYFNITKCLIENGANITAATTFKNYEAKQVGYTSVHFAVRSGNLDIVKYLVEKGADLKATINDGETVLHLAAEDGYLDIVKYLIDDKNVNVNALDTNYERTPLHWAAGNGHSDIIRYLVEKKADVNAKDTSGRTPLHFTIENGNLDTVKYLVEKGADFNSPVTTPHSYYIGYTPLYFATENNHLDIVRYFVEEKHVDLNAKCAIDTGTALHLASAKGYLGIAQYLIEKGAELNIKDIYGYTPLHWATRNGNLDIVKCLVEKGADINARDRDGCTPLTYVNFGGHPDLDIEKYLESKGALRSCNNSKLKKSLKETKISKKNDKIGYKNHNNQAINGTSRSSWVNIFIPTVIDIAKGVSQFIYSPPKPAIEMKHSVSSKEMPIQDTDINGTLLLLDVFVRKITGERYASSADQSISTVEARGYALSIAEKFEEVIKQAANNSNLSLHRLSIDFIKVQKEITRQIVGGKFEEISGILNSHIGKVCPGRETGCPGKLSLKKFGKFMTEFNKKLDVALNQPMQQVLNRGGMLKASNIRKQQTSLEPRIYLNNTSVQGHLTQNNRDLKNEHKVLIP